MIQERLKFVQFHPTNAFVVQDEYIQNNRLLSITKEKNNGFQLNIEDMHGTIIELLLNFHPECVKTA